MSGSQPERLILTLAPLGVDCTRPSPNPVPPQPERLQVLLCLSREMRRVKKFLDR